MPPLISVVVPCLNRADFLPATLDSILTQNHPAIECIVQDGGSTDATTQILQSYQERYPHRLRWHSAPDGGQGAAIQAGWDKSQGEILTWLNADDLWEPGAAAFAADYFDTHPNVDMVYGDCAAIDLEGNRVGANYLKPWDLRYAVEYADHCIPQPASFIRRRALERAGWLDTSFTLIDCELWLRIGLHGTIAYVPHPLACGRRLSAYDRRRFAADRVRIIRTFFQRSDIPGDLRALRHRALSNAYLRGIDDLRTAGRKPRGLIGWYLLRALLADPGNLHNLWERARGPLLHILPSRETPA